MSHPRTTPPLLAAALVSTAVLAAGAGTADAPRAVAATPVPTCTHADATGPHTSPVALADLTPEQVASAARSLGLTEQALRNRVREDPSLVLVRCDHPRPSTATTPAGGDAG